VFTWVQRRVPPAMIGRAMSLFMFIFMGLVPLASAVTGWLLRFVPLQQLFAGSGLLLVLAAAVAWADQGDQRRRLRHAAADRPDDGREPRRRAHRLQQRRRRRDGRGVPQRVTALVIVAILASQACACASRPRHKRMLPVIGLLIGVQSLCLYSAVARLPVALALLAFNTYPIWTALWSFLVYRQRPRRRCWSRCR
jgi:hypothetical protein